MTLEEAIRQRIVNALDANRHNISHTAKAMGVSRRAFYRLLDRHGLVASRTKRYVMRGTPKDKHRANVTVARAIKKGLRREPCAVCGSNKDVEAHHEDYSKPLAITWLCPKHHRQLHTEREGAFHDAALVTTFVEWTGSPRLLHLASEGW